MKRTLLAAIPLMIAACYDEVVNPVSLGDTVSTAETSSSATTGSGTGGAGGSGTGGQGAGGSKPLCPSCAMPQMVGAVDSDKLGEISGIVASHASPGLYFVHNDSGDQARFFAVNGSGKKLATFDLDQGAGAVDWEDIALGPCPAGRCVYLADTGDNLKERKSYTIYRTPEPATIIDETLPFEAFPFTYPDGPHDVETLLVHPTTGVITLVAKTFGLSEIYELPMPLTPGSSVVVIKRGIISLPIEPALITGGDVHPDATSVLLRTYANAYDFPMIKGASVADALLGEACEVPLAFEPQGEAIGWLHDGTGYVTVSEGQGAAINLVTCAPP
ncbi:MAG: hypothetical protein ABI193_01310 [Minicystis sp.]